MEKKDHEFCLRCGRRLKNPVAREIGYGAICQKKLDTSAINRLFSVEVKKFSDLEKVEN